MIARLPDDHAHQHIDLSHTINVEFSLIVLLVVNMGLGRTLTSLSAYVKPESSLITKTLHGGIGMKLPVIDMIEPSPPVRLLQ